MQTATDPVPVVKPNSGRSSFMSMSHVRDEKRKVRRTEEIRVGRIHDLVALAAVA